MVFLLFFDKILYIHNKKGFTILTIKERAKKILSLEEYSNTGKPIKLDHLELKKPEKEQQILRMVICVDGLNFKIPSEIDWVKAMIKKTLKHQLESLNVRHSFCYVTIRHGLVNSEKDDLWHVDGFSTKITQIPEQNYIWCDHTPTEYVDLNVNFPSDFDPLKHNINFYLRNHITNNILQCEEETIYCLDPYILHKRPENTNNKKRTFIRISFVPIEINDVNNTQNPLLKRIYNQDGLTVRDKLIDYNKI